MSTLMYVALCTLCCVHCVALLSIFLPFLWINLLWKFLNAGSLWNLCEYHNNDLIECSNLPRNAVLIGCVLHFFSSSDYNFCSFLIIYSCIAGHLFLLCDDCIHNCRLWYKWMSLHILNLREGFLFLSLLGFMGKPNSVQAKLEISIVLKITESSSTKYSNILCIY